MSFLISDALAAGAAAAPSAQADGGFSLILLAVVGVLFYLMLLRPQNKRAKVHRQLISKIQKGDEIITTGGLLVKVNSVDEQFIKATIADGVEISLQRNAISSVLPKGTIKAL